MLRRPVSLAAVVALLLALLPAGVARAQDDGADDEEPAEPSYYGDIELIETLRDYGLLDEWIAASPVSPEASVLAVSSSAASAERRAFMTTLDAWAAQTEPVRRDLARLDAGQANVDLVRSAIADVREALVRDDRLRGSNSETLLRIAAALDSLATEMPEPPQGEADGPLPQAEVQLREIRARAETELLALKSSEAAVTQSGVTSFAGYDTLQIDLYTIERLIERGRELVRPAQQQAERLAARALAQIPDVHAARMLGPSDVDGLSLATVDAYIRAAAGVACPVDWAMLAAIGKIESNHGRLGGASVSRTGQVSTEILGPLLDGGATARAEQAEVEEAAAAEEEPTVGDTALALRGIRRGIADALLERSGLLGSWWVPVQLLPDSDAADGGAADEGNGFAVIVDSDGGLLDGNDQWDRAVGPMQFLPETWSRWATDGNGDGVADPHNLYDATASAARFLCHLRATRGASPSTYLRGYNDSWSYVRSVLSTAERLRATLLPEV